jgi:solute:Na+ symporter, SSS family
MLGPLDLAVIGVYLVMILGVGLWSGRHQTGTESYFLANRTLPFWAAGLSIVATETSALTFIGAPVQSLRGDWTYLQIAIGSSLARVFVAVVLIGVYYRHRVTTVYDFLHDRFGPISRSLATALFFTGRLLGSGVRLYGASIALVIVAGIDFPLAIALISAVAVVYTLLGGLRAVVFTDVLQGALLLIGGIAALVALVSASDQTVAELWARLQSSATEAGTVKLRVIDLSLDPRVAYTLAAGLIGSTLLTLSTHGTDQDMIQRALGCRDATQSRRSMILSGMLSLPIALMFLAIGSLLWVVLGGDAGSADLAASIAAEHSLASTAKAYDFLFPVYILTTLPTGLKGLIVAAIFATAMSSLDSAISALSTTAVANVWRPLVGAGPDDAVALRMARVFAILFGAALVCVALVVWASEGAGGERQGFGILMLGLKVLSWIFPPLLGLFLVGVLTDRGNDRGNALAVAVGLGTVLVLEFWPQLSGAPAPLAWTWYPVVGCGLCFGVASLFRGGGRGAVTLPAR